MKLWITRDESDRVTLHNRKPRYVCGEYFNNGLCCLPSNTFPEVTFENSPQLVEIKLVKEE